MKTMELMRKILNLCILFDNHLIFTVSIYYLEILSCDTCSRYKWNVKYLPKYNSRKITLSYVLCYKIDLLFMTIWDMQILKLILVRHWIKLFYHCL